VKVDRKMVKIREMKLNEREMVRKLLIESYIQYEKDFSEERWERYFTEVKYAVDNDNIDKLYVALLNDQIVGTVQLFPHSNIAYDDFDHSINAPIIRFLAVHPNGRGQGIGRLLLDKSISYAQKQRAEAIYLHTTNLMPQAVQLYVQYGFEREKIYDYDRENYSILCYKYVIKRYH